jgi:hypothetical protein
MKIAKNVFLIVGIIFICFNLLGLIGGAGVPPRDIPVNKTAYLIGANLFNIVGIIFLFIAYRYHKKITRKKLEADSQFSFEKEPVRDNRKHF